MYNRENGSAALPVLAAVAALFFATTYVQNINSRLAMTIKEAQSDRETSEATLKNLSDISIAKGMILPARIKADTYEPSIYPVNYFSSTWQFKKNENTPTSGGVEKTGEITIDTLKQFGLSSAEAAAYFSKMNSQSSSFKTDSKSVLKIVNLNRDDFHYHYFNSIDLIAESSPSNSGVDAKIPSITTNARIMLPVPEPGAAHLEITKASPIAWNTDFGSPATPLPAGNYKLRVVASGIVYYAEVTRSNGANIILGLANDEISHAANNIHAANVVIGETADIPMGKDETVTVNSSIEASSSISGITTHNADCSFTIDRSGAIPAPALGSTSTTTASSSIAVPMDISYKIFRVDGSESANSGEQKIYFSSTLTTQTIGTIVAEKDATAFACREKCPTTRVQAQTNWMPFLDQSVIGSADKTKLDVLRISESNAISQAGPGGSICGNLELVAQDLVNALGYKLPSDLYITNSKWPIYDSRMTEGGESIKLERLYAYIAPSCERQLVGSRNGCGCFAADTRIKMGDGTEQSADTIRQGDFLWNPIRKESQRVKRVVAGPEKPLLYVIEVEGELIKVTSDHPFLTAYGTRSAKQLKVGDPIINQGSLSRISGISREARRFGDPEPIVWNFELEGSPDDEDHYLVANGTMTGDLYMQLKLKKQNDKE
ncbi:MAG: hypothetical protein H7318_18060 [Oligoflexus sp.]|nr:hypothetical protein [Oligoflexus sp.]